LQNLQHIDFTDNQFDESELLKILYEDKAYYNEHKILLSKALKWQQQNHNPSILLRGYNLGRAETWLKIAQKRTQHPPIPLQLEFITASLQQPPLDSLDVFISYSRADSDLARKLNDALQLQGKTTWFDQESIASGSDFQQEINQGIEASDNFLFIISPRSVNSPYCNSEVEYAASLNKRFITVLHKEVKTKDLHPELAKVQWIDFNRNQKDFNANFNQLLRTIETDREHLRSHSKWLQRALEWEHKNKNDDLLLRGSNLINAKEWLQETEDKKKKPAITSLQKEFIQASQKAVELAEEEKRRQLEIMHLKEEKRKEAEARLAEQEKIDQIKNRSIVGIIIALLVTVGFGIFGFIQKDKAEKAQLTQLNSVSKYSLILSQIDRKSEAILEAISAGEQIKKLDKKEEHKKTRSSILKALQTAVYEDGFRQQNRFKHKNSIHDVAWSSDGNEIVSAIKGDEIKFFNLSNSKENRLKLVETHNKYDYIMFSTDGKKIAFTDKNNNNTILTLDKDEEKTKTPKSLGNGEDFWFDVAWSNDGKTIASVSDDRKIKLWDAEGKFLKTLVDPLDPQEKFTSVSFSGDGKTVASGSLDGKIKLWNVDNGKLIDTILDKNTSISEVSLSPNRKNIAFVSDDDVYLFNLEKKKSQSLTNYHGYSSLQRLVWSHKGDIIAYANKNNTVLLWDTSGKLLQALVGHGAPIKIIKFSPDGKKIATASKDNTVRIWSSSKKKLERFKSPNETEFFSVALNRDGNIIASSSDDNSIKIWTKQGKQKKWESISTHIEYNKDDILSLSPDGNTIAFASEKTIKLWNKQENLIKEIGKHDASVKSIAWSPDGKTIVSVSEDNIIKRWNLDGEELDFFKASHGSVLSVALSPDGKTIDSGSSDNTIKLWNEKGKPFKTLEGHVNDVVSVAFSPDGKTLASTGYDKNLVLWNLDDLTLDKLLEDGCQQVKDYLKFNATGEEEELCKSNS
jgi:WD40 repeat protein